MPFGLSTGLVSMHSFALIAFTGGEYEAELRRLVVIDLVASFLLVLGGRA